MAAVNPMEEHWGEEESEEDDPDAHHAWERDPWKLAGPRCGVGLSLPKVASIDLWETGDQFTDQRIKAWLISARIDTRSAELTRRTSVSEEQLLLIVFARLAEPEEFEALEGDDHGSGTALDDQLLLTKFSDLGEDCVSKLEAPRAFSSPSAHEP